MRESRKHRDASRLQPGLHPVEDECQERVAHPHQPEDLSESVPARPKLEALAPLLRGDPRVGGHRLAKAREAGPQLAHEPRALGKLGSEGIRRRTLCYGDVRTLPSASA